MKLKKIIMRTVISIIGFVLFIVIFLIAGVLISNRIVKTPPFTDNAGNIIKNSIASIEEVELGGYKQTILIRGKSLDNPILLFLHGGPGSPELPLVRHFNSILEDHYIVVNWDQRGAGKSFSPFLGKDSLKVENFLNDTHQLINILRKRFHKDKVYLVGHSWALSWA